MINNEAILNPHIHNSFCCRTKKDKKIEVTRHRQLLQHYCSFFQQLRYLSKNSNINIIFIQKLYKMKKQRIMQHTFLLSNNKIIYLDFGMSTNNPHNNTFW